MTKFRAIYKWVCENIENDYRLFDDNQRNRKKIKDAAESKKWNTTIQARMFETLLKKRKTVCTGYAYLIKELCQLSGITAEIIDGYGRTIAANIGGDGVLNHSWTAVKLNNQWYLCDATWSSGAFDMTGKQFIKKYDDAYFLASPEYFIRNHYPADERWTLLEKNPSLITFLNRPILYSAAYKYKILPQMPEQFEIDTTEKTLSIYLLTESTENFPVSIAINNQLPQRVSLTPDHTHGSNHVLHCALKNNRENIIHVLVRGEVVFTYKVKAKR